MKSYLARMSQVWTGIGNPGYRVGVPTSIDRAEFIVVEIDADVARFLADAINNWVGPGDLARQDAARLYRLADCLDDPPELPEDV